MIKIFEEGNSATQNINLTLIPQDLIKKGMEIGPKYAKAPPKKRKLSNWMRWPLKPLKLRIKINKSFWQLFEYLKKPATLNPQILVFKIDFIVKFENKCLFPQKSNLFSLRFLEPLKVRTWTFKNHKLILSFTYTHTLLFADCLHFLGTYSLQTYFPAIPTHMNRYVHELSKSIN